MISLSLCMIVKNEEKNLARCLDSVKEIVDEIIIVDTGSTDNTKSIAKKYTNKIYNFKWVNDFAKARNFSFSKATKDYIIWLDADDIILKKDKESLIKFKKNFDTSIDIVMLKYNTGFDENGNVNFSYYRERILKRSKNYKWESPIHEVIVPKGNVKYLDIAITHKKENSNYSNRNLFIFEDMLNKGITLDARQQFYYARELYYNEKYNEAITNFENFLNDEKGWIENKISACIDLADCYKKVNDSKNEFLTLTRSFLYDLPRGEICCKIGNIFLLNNDYLKAIFWYNQAISSKPNLTSGGFYNLDSYNFIPYLNICVCYYNLKDITNAIKYNELAGKLKPSDKSYLNNKKFFESLQKQVN